MNHFSRSPLDPPLLLHQHCIQNRRQPILKSTIIIIRNNQIPNPIQPRLPQLFSGKRKGAQVCGGKTLDDVLLNAACGGHDSGDVVVLDEVADCLAETRGDEVGRVAEENSALCGRGRGLFVLVVCVGGQVAWLPASLQPVSTWFGD